MLKHKDLVKKRDMGSYLQDIQKQKAQFEIIEEQVQEESGLDPNERQMMQSRKAFYRELKRVVEESDVLIEVLDARDPQGCRNAEIE